jgi:hypothetical protein
MDCFVASLLAMTLGDSRGRLPNNALAIRAVPPHSRVTWKSEDGRKMDQR